MIEWGEGLDQILHFLWAFFALCPVLIKKNKWTTALTAFLWCLPREFVDQWNGWPPGSGKLLDILFFTLGGFIAGVVFSKKKIDQVGGVLEVKKTQPIAG